MRTRLRALAMPAVALAMAGTAAFAQGERIERAASGNGYLFGAPSAALTLRLGYDAASAGSDVFSFVTKELTLRRGDFGSFAIGGDLAITLTPRMDLVLSVDNDGMSKKSEYREWQDNSGNPIEQMTSFSRLTYAAGVRYYVAPKGRSLGRFAWVPARYTPWVSLGVGRTSYDFSQNGDFIDFAKGNAVFPDTFKSSQWTTTGQVGGGVDWTLNQRFSLTTQVKYLWGKADLGTDFVGFAPIDLSGVGASGGLTIRF
ncbi:MAG: hypothetical protein U9Q74_00830 [Gemmatimonadota bacterium]|nr:hypothetical protein [Gemmatimonadota bacterium]